ncbi:hypothetical protein SCP_0214510 [Sparassis crispa]|uniref:Uncharacterized protein n=1 Tax=Sparassis crispa TaxID=139825 RepID=A0A401GDN2_9APHY|nr:hypothetical protein SCP_0214510 [Sparassis crispa]GBE80241.1 hypothetical protein SCP_0214510 [Sparassis crispa]
MYWASGSCGRGFECQYKHERAPNAAASSGPPTVAEEEVEPDFFSAEGLAANVGSVREQRHMLNPSEAHNHVRPFLSVNYHFESAAKVQGFVRILASVNDRNKSWDSAKAQAFLDMVVNGNAILRVGEVLRFEPVNHRIGMAGGVLSFQKGYFPIFEYFASNLVLKSTLHKNINHLYTVIENNYETVHNVIHTCVGGLIREKSWKDSTPNLTSGLQSSLDGVVVFKTLSTVLLQYFNRFKDAIRNHPGIVDLVLDLATWFNTWADDVCASPPRFDDVITSANTNIRNLTIAQLREEITRLQTIVEREAAVANRLRRPAVQTSISSVQRQQALVAQLVQTYDPPGQLRPEGPRHDNDFEDISSIRIAPTHEELLCPVPPYLPVFVHDAPHHHAAHSMERHLDIQFRLLREEMIATIRSSITSINGDLASMWSRTGRKKEKTKLEELLNKKGGAYRSSGYDSVFFQLYTNVEFLPVKAERRDLTVGLLVDTPPGTARDTDVRRRYDYWSHTKRLQGGSLVALIIVSHRQMRIFLGEIKSFNKDIAESSKANNEKIQVRLKFFDAEVELMALRRESMHAEYGSKYAVLLDNSVMFEAVRPFLERLQTIEPTEIPFSRYISRNGALNNDVPVLHARYATAPRFRFNLQCLAKHGQTIPALDISQPDAVTNARQQLRQASHLDPSQVDAVVDTLTREVSLIQGPPGTGKSYTGKEILRILFASGIKPIVLIAYTNHALDHMLSSVLDAGITQNLVRLGSRSSDERIAEYTLDKLEKVAGATEVERTNRRQYAKMKKLEEDMIKVMESIQLPILTWEKIQEYLEIHYPEHADSIETPPYWVQMLTARVWEDEEENGEFATVERKKKQHKVDTGSRTLYGFWRNGQDLQYISPPSPQQPKHKKKRKQAETESVTPATDSSVIEFFTSLGFNAEIPPVPTSARPTDILLNLQEPRVWSMSLDERRRLAGDWEQDIRIMAYHSKLHEYEELRESYKDACQEYNDIKDEARRRLLSKTDLIGCTTTGAAKLTSLLTNIAPRVLMVEEAGQVLEAHILTSLVSSVHHLICIGDPQQLRPSLATYSLSMDSERGNELYKFDRSLMERLSNAGMPMSQINVQRRMRPEISHYIRTILYKNLEDNDVVQHYPRVQGMQRNVYFLSHIKPESGAEDSVSKFNMYEVEMIRDLVLYFLKQGPYSGPGDIAVLCAYLGQLQKVRAALRDLKISVALDERDQEQLERQGLEEEGTEYEEVIVAQHVRLGTVDIFQGQEAKIVIVSLVRNSGSYETGSASIGFLKSSNRINVALSRAKHGLYILGNASNLRKNPTWSTIVDEMEARDQIGTGFPTICPRHPDQTQVISQPGELNRLSPGGGCLLPCGFRLGCGHICPSSCHAALDNHRSTKCHMPCNRTPCPRSHPCSKHCSDDCGDCEFPMYEVALPCGHVKDKVPCYLLEKLESVKCQKLVRKQLPRCEHSVTVACSQDTTLVQCKEPCGGTLQCCSKTCKSTCNDCQRATAGAAFTVRSTNRINRTSHVAHPCERLLNCQHRCGLDCSQDHHCNTKCSHECRQRCIHHECPKLCSAPCAPCMEPCIWRCAHQTCPVLCGSICTRLPCDEPCTETLECGHPCPSVCGEPCASQKCPLCLPEDRKADIVDFIMQRKLGDLDLSSTDVSERLITLYCGHLFTVETLDGHCRMSEYYEVDPSGRYLAPMAPPINYQTPPTCPTCRGPITALRYGRVTKRATLDILEQNVAGTMSQAIEEISPQVVQLSEALEASQKAAKEMKSVIPSVEEIPDCTAAAAGKANEPLSYDLLNKGAMRIRHGLDPAEATAWFAIVKDLLKAYQRIVAIAVTRGAHVKAYEAALVTLFRLEMDALAADPEKATAAPEPLAMAAVNTKIGQPPHKADTRFQIEAFFFSLELRFTLAQIGVGRIEGIATASTEPDVAKHRGVWCAFVAFVYESCTADAKKAVEMAQRSSASRQAARASVYGLRVMFERFRFQIMMERAEYCRNNRWTNKERGELARRVKDKKKIMALSADSIQKAYICSRPSQSVKELTEELQWFSNNCRSRIDRWEEDCDGLESSLLRDTIYQPVSLQEQEDIVKAFNFTHGGHFYNCENGHTFVITECGGAMQAARCPECHAAIGGTSHNLHQSNTRATEFEEIATRLGSERSPWAWGR